MRYVRAQDIFPAELLKQIQEYVDGEYIYIPRKGTEKRGWGEKNRSRDEIALRNSSIYAEHLAGLSIPCLAESYFLSEKSISRIILEQKRKSC